MTEEPLLPDQPKEPPHYQRFVGFVVLLPVEVGKRQYHRVVITGTHKDLEEDLGQLLPKQVRKLLSRSRNQELWERTKRRVGTTTPNREAYYAFCSCGAKDCDHLDSAIEHFSLIQHFAENSGQIVKEVWESRNRLQEYTERIGSANVQLQSFAGELDRLKADRAELANSLQAVKEEDEELARSLSKQLEEKTDEFERLQGRERDAQAEREVLLSEKQNLQAAYNNSQENLKAISREIGTFAARRHTSPDKALPDDVSAVVGCHFALEASDLPPESKLASSIYSDHHKALNVEAVAQWLAAQSFVKYVGLSYRHEATHSKVTVMPHEYDLELIVPDGDNANVLKIRTTARSKPQQLLAAYLIAEQFNAKVDPK